MKILKAFLFLKAKGKVVRFQQQNEALFVWYVIVYYAGLDLYVLCNDDSFTIFS